MSLSYRSALEDSMQTFLSKQYIKRDRHHHALPFLSMLLGLFVSPPFTVHSQESQIDTAQEVIQLEEITVEEITVQAERVTPIEGASATVVTAQEIQETTATDVSEVIKSLVPGVTGQRRGGINLDPVIRGLREDRLSVMTNGTKIWGGGPFRMDPPTSLLDLDELALIEVIKGPYSVTRGPSSIGGTINLVTKEPEFSPTWYVQGSLKSLYVSNYDGWATRASIWGGGPSLAFRLSGGYRDYQDYDSGDGERVPSGFQSRSVSSHVIWQPAPNHKLRLSYSWESDRNTRFAALPLNLEEDDASLTSATYTITDPLPSVQSLEFTGYYNYVHHRMHNQHKPNRRMINVVFPLDARTFGGRVQANILRGIGGRLSLGGDVYRLEREGTNHITFLRAGNTAFFDIWPDTHIVDGGIFGEYAYSLSPQWRIVVGTRVDFVDAGANPDARVQAGYVRFNGPGADKTDEFETNVSANARLIYSPMDTLDLFIGVGRGVRTADATERFFALGPGPGGFFVGNPRLDPEESLQVDVGATGSWGKLRFDGSFFYNRIDDYILPFVITRSVDINGDGRNDIVRGWRNIDYATLMGVDFGLQYALRDNLQLFGSFAYVHGESEDDNRALPEIPPLEGRLGFRYDDFTHNLWIKPSLRLVQSQHRIGTGFGEDITAGFVTVDLAAGIRLRDRYEFTVNVANLLDKNYVEHLTRDNPFTGREIPEPGRVVSVSLRVTF